MIKKFNDLLEAPVGIDEKLHMYSTIKKDLETLYKDFFHHHNSNTSIIIREGIVDKINISHKYSDIELFNNNKKLFLLLFKNLFSPNKSTEEYSKYFHMQEENFIAKENILTVDFIKKLFGIESFNENLLHFFYEDEIMFSDIEEEDNDNIFYLQSIFQPSFEALYEISNKIDFIDFIDFTFLTNQQISSRNKSTKVILPSGIGQRNNSRDKQLEPSNKNLIKNLYNVDNQSYNINVDIKFHLTKKLDFQEEFIFKDFLFSNGMTISKSKMVFPKSITDFDLFMLLSNIKV